MSTRKTFRVIVTLSMNLAILSSFAQGIYYDEQVSGDLSIDSVSPAFEFGIGVNTIIASAYTYVGGTLDADRFSFSVANDGILTSINLTITNGEALQTTVEVGPTFSMTNPLNGFIGGTGGINAIGFVGTQEILSEYLPIVGDTFGNIWWSTGGYIIGTPPRGGSWDYKLEFIVEAVDSDVDGDNVSDFIDNCTHIANTNQIDADGDGFGNQCDADFDNNCIVNFLDLSYFKTQFMSNDLLTDINTDGVVNFLDLTGLVNQFLLPPGPSSVAQQCPSQ